MSESNTVLLPVWESIQTAWAKVSGFKGTFWGAYLLILFIMFCVGILDGILQYAVPKIEPVFALVGQVINYLLSMGIIYLGIRRAFDIPTTFKNVFDVFRENKPWKLIGLYILQILIILACMLVLAVGVALAFAVGIIEETAANNPPAFHFSNPGMVALVTLILIFGFCLVVYVATRLWLSAGFVLDRGYGPIDALSSGFKASRSNFWRIVGYALLQIFFMIISVIPLGIGLIWSLPWMVICYGVGYKNLVVNADIANQGQAK